jgi:hypothetical protein
MNQALYAHMNNKRTMKKKRLLDFLEESLINLCNIKLVIKDILRGKKKRCFTT